MILLANDTAEVDLDVAGSGRSAICVRHRSYDAPTVRADCAHMTWEDFLGCPEDALRGRDTMIVVGLNRIITPSNRTKVGPLLLRPRPGLQRVSVDRTLFVGEPWRAWFHFGCTATPYREYTYSYLAESHWKAAQEGIREDPFSVQAIADCGDGQVFSLDATHFRTFDVERIALPADVHEAYAEEKAAAFEEEHTPAAIIGRLSEVAKKHLPRRSIPTSTQLFDRRDHRIVQTDLKVDDYLVGRLRSLVEMTNDLAERFNGC